MLHVIDNLTNWYIRFNRKRLKGGAGLGLDDTTAALSTLLEVLFTLACALAPFTPFITEHIYGLLKPHLGDLSEIKDSRSVHFLPFPVIREVLINDEVERKFFLMQKVIQLERAARDQYSVTLKTPLPLRTLVVIADPHIIADVESLKTYILEKLNVREIMLTGDERRFNIQLEAKVDWPVLGKKLKKDIKVVRDGLSRLSQEELRQYARGKRVSVGGIELGAGDLAIVRVLRRDASGSGTGAGAGDDGPAKRWEPAFADEIVVLLDAAVYPELNEEGLARDILSRV